jgi:SAM-dependent methyltransferase
MELTQKMLELLDVQPYDQVVEFAPGVGTTAQLTLSRAPAQYTAIERDEAAVRLVSGYLKGPNQQCVIGRAENTGLPDASATVVLGEAMLTMQTASHKEQIITEAARILKPGGRYGIHEVCLKPDDLDDATKNEIEKALSEVSRVGTRPLTQSEWRALLEGARFHIRDTVIAPFHLLEPPRVLRDEGPLGTLRLLGNVLRDGAARQRVIAMRSAIRRYQDRLAAIAFVAVKPGSE